MLSNVPVLLLALAFLIMHELNDYGSQKEDYFSRSEKKNPGSIFPRFSQLVRVETRLGMVTNFICNDILLVFIMF